MGISIHLAEVILREHLYRPLPNAVHTIGRPFMGFTEAQMLAMFRRCQFTPRPYTPRFDDYTNEGKDLFAKTGHRYISDRTFFEALGVKKVGAIDISDYEGAEIVCNLSYALPKELYGATDFIVGGSTLDNVFDPAQYMRNMTNLLRPGGRLIEINHANNHKRPYVMLPQPWYFDYFVVNGFKDCKLYAWEISNALHVYKLMVGHNPKQQVGWGLIDNYETDENLTVVNVFIAEKDKDSTSDIAPTQDSYRSAEEVATYNENLLKLLKSGRPFQTYVIDEMKPASLAANTPPRNYHYVGHFPIDA